MSRPRPLRQDVASRSINDEVHLRRGPRSERVLEDVAEADFIVLVTGTQHYRTGHEWNHPPIYLYYPHRLHGQFAYFSGRARANTSCTVCDFRNVASDCSATDAKQPAAYSDVFTKQEKQQLELPNRLQVAESSHLDEVRNPIPKVGRGSFHVGQYKSFGAAMQRKTASFDKIPQAARDS